jgi:hypothetical protein
MGVKEIAMTSKVNIKELRITFTNWAANVPAASSHGAAWREQFETEAKMLLLEELHEINESLKKLALLGDCTEVWHE